MVHDAMPVVVYFSNPCYRFAALSPQVVTQGVLETPISGFGARYENCTHIFFQSSLVIFFISEDFLGN